MKNIFLLAVLINCCFSVYSQEQHTINSETLELKTEISGALDLLWTVINKEYRYFVKKDGVITELTNTKDASGVYKNEYKATLANLTNGSTLNTDKLKFTLYSLMNFINDYNISQDSNYVSTINNAVVSSRLLIFGGITNSPFIENPTNTSNPQFGIEIEVFEGNITPRHSLLFELKHVLDNDEFKYSTTQLSIGYRYRLVKTDNLNIYANIIAAAYNFSKNTITFDNEADEIITKEVSNNTFDAPFIFGIGADFKISSNGFITLTYNELFALALDNADNFSTHIALGYKFNL